MTTAIYPSARDALLKGQIDLTNGKLMCVAMNNGFTVNETYTSYADVKSSAVGGVSVLNGAVSGNKFTGTFPNLTGVPSGTVITALVLYMKTSDTDDTQNMLIGYDTSAVNLPFTADGGQIMISFPSNLIVEIS